MSTLPTIHLHSSVGYGNSHLGDIKVTITARASTVSQGHFLIYLLLRHLLPKQLATAANIHLQLVTVGVISYVLWVFRLQISIYQ